MALALLFGISPLILLFLQNERNKIRETDTSERRSC